MRKFYRMGLFLAAAFFISIEMLTTGEFILLAIILDFMWERMDNIDRNIKLLVSVERKRFEVVQERMQQEQES